MSIVVPGANKSLQVQEKLWTADWDQKAQARWSPKASIGTQVEAGIDERRDAVRASLSSISKLPERCKGCCRYSD